MRATAAERFLAAPISGHAEPCSVRTGKALPCESSGLAEAGTMSNFEIPSIHFGLR